MNPLGYSLQDYLGRPLTKRQRAMAEVMSHTGQYANRLPPDAQAWKAQNDEINRQNDLIAAHSQLPDARVISAPPVNALMKQPTAFDQAMARWTGPDEGANVTNALTDVLGSQFAGGLVPAAQRVKTSGLMSLFDPRIPSSQVNMMTYHGSPHRINNVDDANPMGRFDLSKIGTGEGAQAYGHGIYLAESPGVAKGYQTSLGDVDLMVGGKPIDVPHSSGTQGYEGRTADFLVRLKKEAKLSQMDNATDLGEYSDEAIDNVLSAMKAQPDTPEWDLAQSFKGQGISATPRGHFYEVDLPDEHIDNMLDWDAPLSEQPQAVKKAYLQHNKDIKAWNDSVKARGYVPNAQELMMSEVAPTSSGAVFYNSLSGLLTRTGKQTGGASADDLAAMGFLPNRLVGPEASSAQLNKLGIPGIKYLDGNSRTAGEGTRNFVVFDPDKAKILSRNGEKAALPMDEVSRMARARDMGFNPDQEWYHGTKQTFDEFDPDSAKSEGNAFYFSNSKTTMKAPYFAENANKYAKGKGGNVIPARLKMKNPMIAGYTAPMNAKTATQAEVDEWLKGVDEFNRGIDYNKNEYFQSLIDEAKRKGHDGVIIKNVEDVPGGGNWVDPTDVAIVFEPSQVRSRFAAFDPAKKDSANLMHGVGAAGAGGLLYNEQEKPNALKDAFIKKGGGNSKPRKPRTTITSVRG